MIDVTGLRFSHDPGLAPEVLNGIDLTIVEGEFVGIVGRNGSGKSSLARALNGLNQPTSGNVLVDGLNTRAAADIPTIRRKVQLVFQNPENQQVGLTAFEDIAFGLSNFGVPGGQMPEIARRSLNLVGLDVEFDRDVNTLSGGELQRLALAGVLALEPTYLVLDEATAMLDPAARAEFLRTLAEVRANTGLSVIQITHHIDEVLGADRLVAIRDGRIEAQGQPGELINDHALLELCGVEPVRAAVRPAVAHRTDSVAVEAANLSVTYRHKRRRKVQATRALDHFDLKVASGELLAIAGSSGAGKSTLVTALKGLIKPVGGSLRIDGVDPWSTKTLGLFDRVGYAFQFPEHQLFALTVKDDVGYGLKHLRLPADDYLARVSTALDQVGLDAEAFLERSPFDLSGGEQRRVALAGVIVNAPSILVLDEPTAGLDYPSRTQLFGLLDQLRAQGTTVIWVSHRLDEIYEHADRVAILSAGRLEVEGDPAVVFADIEAERAA